MSPVTLNVKAFRKALRMSQQELADAVGVRQATISDLEKGKQRTLRLDLLERLARALGVPARELIVETPADPARG